MTEIFNAEASPEHALKTHKTSTREVGNTVLRCFPFGVSVVWAIHAGYYTIISTQHLPVVAKLTSDLASLGFNFETFDQLRKTTAFRPDLAAAFSVLASIIFFSAGLMGNLNQESKEQK